MCEPLDRDKLLEYMQRYFELSSATEEGSRASLAAASAVLDDWLRENVDDEQAENMRAAFMLFATFMDEDKRRRDTGDRVPVMPENPRVN